jgi:hypothetical protein
MYHFKIWNNYIKDPPRRMTIAPTPANSLIYTPYNITLSTICVYLFELNIITLMHWFHQVTVQSRTSYFERQAFVKQSLYLHHPTH